MRISWMNFKRIKGFDDSQNLYLMEGFGEPKSPSPPPPRMIIMDLRANFDLIYLQIERLLRPSGFGQLNHFAWALSIQWNDHMAGGGRRRKKQTEAPLQIRDGHAEIISIMWGERFAGHASSRDGNLLFENTAREFLDLGGHPASWRLNW